VTKYINAEPNGSRNWNGHKLNHFVRSNWGASMVPEAAVLPAPVAYVNVAAVKKSVVKSQGGNIMDAAPALDTRERKRPAASSPFSVWKHRLAPLGAGR